MHISPFFGSQSLPSVGLLGRSKQQQMVQNMGNHAKKDMHMPKIVAKAHHHHRDGQAVSANANGHVQPVQKLNFHYPAGGEGTREEILYNAFTSYYHEVHGMDVEPTQKLRKYFKHISRGYGELDLSPSRVYIQQLVYNDRVPDQGYLPKLFAPLNFAADILAFGPSMLDALNSVRTGRIRARETQEEKFHRHMVEAVEKTIGYLDIERKAGRQIGERAVAKILQEPLQLLDGENANNWQERAEILAAPILAAWEQNYDMLFPDALDPLNLNLVEQTFVQSFAKTNHIRLALISTKLQHLGENAEKMAQQIASAILFALLAPLEKSAFKILKYQLSWEYAWKPLIQEKIDHTWESVQLRMAASLSNLVELGKELDRQSKDGAKTIQEIIEFLLYDQMAILTLQFPTKTSAEHSNSPLEWVKNQFVNMLNDTEMRPKIGNLDTIAKAEGQKEVEFRLTIPMDPNSSHLVNHPPNENDEQEDYEYLERRRKRGGHTEMQFTADQFHSLIFGTDAHNQWLYVHGTFCPNGCKH